jgi:hypothetical protein
MPRIRFVGDSETCAWLGVNFERDEWVADHGLGPEEIERVTGHPHFEVESTPKPGKPKA